MLLVGAGNSGAEIAMELAPRHRVWMSGRHPGQVPFRFDSFLAKHLLIRLLFRLVFHRLLSAKTPIGRKARAQGHTAGVPLIRQRPKQLAAAGVTRAARTIGVRDGRPLLDDGRALDVANVIWCTGFRRSFPWIDLPIFDEKGSPRHESGVHHFHRDAEVLGGSRQRLHVLRKARPAVAETGEQERRADPRVD